MAVLSASLNRFQPSAIAEIFSLALRLREEGRDIVNLSSGEPDFDTEANAKQAAVEAIAAGETKYTNIDGTTVLKRAVQAKFKRDNGLDYGMDQILVDAGAKPLLAHGMQAVLDPGDEVIIPVPCWTSYMGMARLFGGEPKLVPCREENGFKLQPEDLEGAITARSKLVLLNSPCNPTGAAYTEDELKALIEVLLRHEQIWIFADDIYEHIVYDGFRFVTPAQVEPRIFDRTLTINGVSKAYAMTGWRIGFAGGPTHLIEAIRKVLTQSTGNPSSISQAAAAEALTGPQDFLAERAEAFRQRRDLVVGAINQMPGLRCSPPEGAFYLYPNCAGLLGKRTEDGTVIESSHDFAKHLLERWGVAVVPGSAFACDPYIRLSYAASTAELEDACRRIGRACGELN